MKRREFIGLVGGAIAGPLAARAQQKGRAYRIAVLLGGSPAKSPYGDIVEKSFKALGWSPGRDLEIEYRSGAGDTELNKAHAKEIIGMKPDAILAMTNSAMAALHREASAIPTVFVMVSDPVRMHYVDSFARPGGNVTGFTPFDPSLGAKWVSLLKQIVPTIENVGLIYNPEPGNNLASFAGPIEAVAPSLGVKSITKPVGDSTGIERVISTLGEKPNSGLIFLPDAFTAAHSEAIVGAVAQLRLPAIYPLRAFCDAGGLISYGVNVSELLEQGISYVSRILRGAQPADLPVQAPTRFELVINLKAAMTMGLVVPPSLIAVADDVIE
jgi:putative ABC transport system substrate-binding protein